MKTMIPIYRRLVPSSTAKKTLTMVECFAFHGTTV